jgi:hypothetical protein
MSTGITHNYWSRANRTTFSSVNMQIFLRFWIEERAARISVPYKFVHYFISFVCAASSMMTSLQFRATNRNLYQSIDKIDNGEKVLGL